MTRMASEGAEELAGLRIPELNRQILASTDTGQHLPIGTPRHAVYIACMASEGEERLYCPGEGTQWSDGDWQTCCAGHCLALRYQLRCEIREHTRRSSIKLWLEYGRILSFDFPQLDGVIRTATGQRQVISTPCYTENGTRVA